MPYKPERRTSCGVYMVSIRRDVFLISDSTGDHRAVIEYDRKQPVYKNLLTRAVQGLNFKGKNIKLSMRQSPGLRQCNDPGP